MSYLRFSWTEAIRKIDVAAAVIEVVKSTIEAVFDTMIRKNYLTVT